MKIIQGEKLTQKKWDEFVINNSSDFGLLQSWAWGEFYKKRNKTVIRLAVNDGKEILAIASIIKMPLKFGKSYLYIPRGPITKNQEALDFLFSEIKKLAKQEKASFLRFDPAWQSDELMPKQAKFIGQVQPKQTLILDLKKSEADLLKEMKSKTRYNIKVAGKHNVVIDEGEKYLADFWRLTENTYGRKELKAHPKEYYENFVKSLPVKIKVAKIDDQVVAANLVVEFGSWSIYFYGASDYENRDKMAPFLLQWETIRQAKNNGQKFYDFWGVDEKKWPGVTRFKIGFAPKTKITSYIGAYDIVYNKFWYLIYQLINFIRRR